MLLGWIKTAQDIVESKGTIVSKSFKVAGITNREEELIRSDSAYQEIKKIMEDVFGEEHLGFCDEDTDEDPFADCTSDDDSPDNEDLSDEDKSSNEISDGIDPFKDSCEESD